MEHLWLTCLLCLSGITLVRASSRPNIVFILADDLGWDDVSFHGSDEIPTPNLDALAYDGIILSNYYVQPICTPTRSALMTGRHPIHTGLQRGVITSSAPYGLGLNETLLPQYLNTLGYSSHIVGKWHLGFVAKEYAPTNRGFKSHYGYWQGCGDYYDHTYYGYSKKAWGLDFRRNMDVVKDAFGQYSTELFSNEAENIVKNHDTSDPLFLYMAHQAVHSANLQTGNNLEAPYKYVSKFPHIKNKQRRLLAGMISAMDDAVGNLTKALKAKGMLENTIIVFSTDNGGPANGFDGNMASNFPLRGLKSTLWEGGVRGAGFVWSPLLKQSGVVSDKMVQVIDWLPTLLSAAGYDMSKLPDNIDGMDLWGTLSGTMDKSRTEMLHNIDKSDGVALRINDMKLVLSKGSTAGNDDWYDPKQVLNDVEDEVELSEEEEAEVKKSLFKSDLPQLLVDMGRPVREGKPLVVTCGPRPTPGPNCKKSACVFNITADPCEYNDLSAKLPEVKDKLMWWYQQYNATVVPPKNKPNDPNGLPFYHGGIWTPWINLTAKEVDLARAGLINL